MRIGNGPRASAVWIVGLGLVMLTTMKGAVWAQTEATQTGTHATGAVANPSGLPHAMAGDTFAQALQRMQTATGVVYPSPPYREEGHLPQDGYLRYELKMVDYMGGEHTGTYETWDSKDENRTYIHTDTYNWNVAWKDKQNWGIENGIRPLRVKEFTDVRLMPVKAVMRLLLQEQKLKSRNVDGVQMLCAGESDIALICFDPSTGFITLSTRDKETVSYEGWKQIGSRYMASVVRMTHGKNLLFEAKLTAASDEVPPDAIAIPTGAIQAAANTTFNERDGLVNANRRPLLGSSVGLFMRGLSSSGEAQAKVWVDEKGRVTKAEIEDADDIEIANAVLSAAKDSHYRREFENGHSVCFETFFDLGTSVGGGMGVSMPGMGTPGVMRR